MSGYPNMDFDFESAAGSSQRHMCVLCCGSSCVSCMRAVLHFHHLRLLRATHVREGVWM